MIKYKQIISCAFCSLLIGCASSTDSVKVDFLDEKEMVSVHNLIHTINSEDLKSFNEIKKIIDENIPRMKNEVDRDNAIIKYIQIYNNLVVNAMNKLSYLGYEMEEVISQYEVEINNISSYDKIPNEYGTVKGFLNEIYSNGLVLYLHSNNQGYSIQVDYSKIKNEYEEHTSNELAKYLNFLDYEIKNDLNLFEKEIDLEEIKIRLEMLYDIKHTDTYLSNKIEFSKTTYEDFLLGKTHSYFVDENGEFLNYVSQFYQNEIDNKSSISVLIKEILQ